MKPNRRSFLAALASAAVLVVLPRGNEAKAKVQDRKIGYVEFDYDGNAYWFPLSSIILHHDGAKYFEFKTELRLPLATHNKIKGLYFEDDPIPMKIVRGTREFNCKAFVTCMKTNLDGAHKPPLLELEMVSCGRVTGTTIDARAEND